MKQADGNLYLALEILIKACLEQQKSVKHSIYGSVEWIDQFCTVKMASARETGHSTAILRYCLNHPNQNFAILCGNKQMADRLQDSAKADWGLKNVKIASLKNENHADHLRGIRLDGVFFDCSFWISADQKRKIIQATSPVMSANDDGYFYAFIQ